jgi:hypothetical protein
MQMAMLGALSDGDGGSTDTPPGGLMRLVAYDGGSSSPPPPRPEVTIALHDEALIPDAGRVTAALRPKFRACYAMWLAHHEPKKGSAKLLVAVLPDGEVSKVTTKEEHVDPLVTKCVTRAITNAQFSAPGRTDGGFVSFSIDLSFAPPPPP